MQRNASRQSHWVGVLSVIVALFAAMPLCRGESPPKRIAQVYECRINDQRVFSDQPCAADATKRAVTTPNSMSAQEATIGYRASRPVPTKHESARDKLEPNAKRQTRCAALLNDKSNLTSRLRAGYTNKQGERLRDRLRKVDGQYYDLRCSALR